MISHGEKFTKSQIVNSNCRFRQRELWISSPLTISDYHHIPLVRNLFHTLAIVLEMLTEVVVVVEFSSSGSVEDGSDDTRDGFFC